MLNKNEKVKTVKGLTVWFDFGTWGTPTIRLFNNPTIIRICFGWFSFAIVTVDIENVLYTLQTEIETLREQIKKSNEKSEPQGRI